ncbi:MAG: flagellar biosynthesis protein FlhB [Candidatus Riflebacteria bacterium]|nr:flagellar biosynthesis protein FlhB [Candidatus Riflebacteria bacterium]
MRLKPFPEADSKRLVLAEIPFDLQLFAGDKTEPATGKRREDERNKGNVPKSVDASSVAILLVSLLVLKFYGNTIIAIMLNYMKYVLESAIHFTLDVPQTSILINGMLLNSLKCLVPMLLMVIITAVGINLAQIGFMFSVERIFAFDLDKFNPFSNLGNLMSWNSIGELVRALFKIGIIGYVPYSTLRDKMPTLIRFVQLDPVQSLSLFSTIAFDMAMKIILFFLFIAIADWYFQNWRYEENIKMSKEEIKEEYKQMEGDPKVKQKIKERQRKLATQKMMAEVPKATVVVTNPTHIAVALKYDEQEAPVPKIVAMGAGLIAQKIKEIAKENNIPIIENKPLARSLFEKSDIGDEIPQELWATVAELLAQVYKMRG